MSFENDALKAVFDTTNGTLVELINKATGWPIIHPDAPPLSFKMQVPLPDRRSHIIDGSQQVLSNYQRDTNGTSATFTWNALKAANGEALDINFIGKISMTPEGLTFSATVDNQSPYTVEAVAWPCIGGIQPSHPERKLERQTVSWMNLGTAELWPNFLNNKGYWGSYTPVEGAHSNRDSLFATIAEADQGLYIGLHDPTLPYLAHWVFEQNPGPLDCHRNIAAPTGQSVNGEIARIEFGLQHFPYLKAGDTKTLSPVLLQGYQGSWQRGCDLYKQWRQTWHKRPQVPAWINEPHSWLQIQIYASADECNFRYKDLPEIARDCKEYGIQAIQLTGWADGGQDRGNPSHKTDPALGTEEELKAAIAECEAMGVRIILFTKWTWWDQSRDDYNTEGIKHVSRNPFGHPWPAGGYQYYSWTQWAGIDASPLVPTCTASEAWRERALEEFKRVTKLGASGMLFDECQHHGNGNLCFSPDHGHPVPAFVYHYDNELVQLFKEHSKEVVPDFLYSGELCYDVEMQEYHLLYTRFIEGHLPGYRYVAPEAPIMMQATGFNDRNQLNRCLEYKYIVSYEPFNFKGRPSDAPDTVKYGRLIDELRLRYRQWLWDAEYCGQQGDISVTANGKVTKDYSLFRNPQSGQYAVVICNTSHKENLRISIAGDGTNGWQRVTPEAPEPVPCSGTSVIPQQSACVWFPTTP